MFQFGHQQERDKMKGKQLRLFSMLDKMEDFQLDHDGPCIEQKKNDNAILARVQVEKTGSGSTVHSLCERSRTGKIETASGTEVATKQDFRNVQKWFISWGSQFDHESATGLYMKITPLPEEEKTPEFTPHAADQASKGSPKAGDLKNSALHLEEKHNAGDSSQMNKYRKKKLKKFPLKSIKIN
ncbi:hypothetical protein RFI_11600 [Reticulomyxa filosa]|uniref:Uncharacterized protein n=1 Tax=Reticulomyxa filosa TaxID=46433 RepID=X6NJK5_RETFI|nr:hypothetical protein RFI_11600 [Reticulomyxa filosa]|eukprot:ETO25537.1 hypothetical protein RFI_11600 [Reticulomyxa filosa]